MNKANTKTSNFLIRSKREMYHTNKPVKQKTSSSTEQQPFFFRIEPRVLKFNGFALNKRNTKKLVIVNTSSKIQRLMVLPVYSDSFEFHFEKKGKLAPGMGQEIKVSLIPKKYSYYHANIRVVSEDEDFLIPIHGFPVMNQNRKHIFPMLIDFGIKMINETHIVSRQLKNLIPVNFEYHFKVKNKSEEICILNPKGVVPGEGTIDVSFEFKPVTPKTLVCEAEVS